MADIRRFFEARHKASDTMVAATLQVAPLNAPSPVAMIIGAAHTDRVCRLFEAHNRAYVVVAPTSGGVGEKSSLSSAAFERKMELRSVDEQGLGALLDGRKKATGKKKPPPVLKEEWFRLKTEVALVGQKMAAGGAGQPPKDPPFGLA